MSENSLRLAEKIFEKIPKIPEYLNVREIADALLNQSGIAANYYERLEFASELAAAISYVRFCRMTKPV